MSSAFSIIMSKGPESEPGAVDEPGKNLTEPSHILSNVTWWYMKESQEIDSNILKLYELNRKVDGWAYYCLIIAYSLLIFLGSCGNILVVCVIVRKPAMRTARNMFILNLAISDLLLCLVTMPLTLMEILTRYWPLGHNSFFCKIIGTSQAISIYVSTLSITAIALDRYQVIVYPTRDSLHRFGAIMILGGIWLSSTILASPMYFCRKLEIHYNISLPQIGIDSIAYCLEDWSVKHGRAYYSIFVLVIQYVLPIIIVSVAYTRICKKLQYRYVSTTVVKKDNELSRRKSREDRRRKTNSLLIAIALVYCISWLPLDICNVIFDFSNPFGEDYHTTMVVYAVCHMMGMSSACSNPLLYGWLNDNFRKEFKGELSSARDEASADLESHVCGYNGAGRRGFATPTGKFAPFPGNPGVLLRGSPPRNPAARIRLRRAPRKFQDRTRTRSGLSSPVKPETGKGIR